MKKRSSPVQRWTKRWALGCVNLRPAAIESQEAGFAQPRAHLLSDPCNTKCAPPLHLHLLLTPFSFHLENGHKKCIGLSSLQQGQEGQEQDNVGLAVHF